MILGLMAARASIAFIKGRSTVKRADVLPTSDILEHVSSTAAGVSTIRAFGAVNWHIEQMHTHLDRLSTARRYFWTFNRWASYSLI